MDGSFVIDVERAGVEGELLAFMDEHEYSPAVLRDVRAGSDENELQLGEPDFIRLEVRDPSGREPGSYRASLYWMLAGHQVGIDTLVGGVETPPRDRVHGLRWPRCPVPFTVDVRAREHHERSFGPFEPAEVGAVLVVEVEPFARVRGIVRSGGEPVPEADVQMRLVPEPAELDLELRRRRWTGWSQPIKTDESGRFDLVLQETERYELRAWKVPEGEGWLGPIELDGARGTDNIEIAIDRAPGAVEGVKLPIV